MAFIVTPGALAAVQSTPMASSYLFGNGLRAMNMGGDLNLTYEEIWRRQPAVRTVVGFIARELSQIGIRTIQRVSENEVNPLPDHPAQMLLNNPRPGSKVTQYRLLNEYFHDRCIYDNAYILKVRPDNGPLAALVRVPPSMVTPHAQVWYDNDAYVIVGNSGQALPVPADSMIHSYGYNPLGIDRLGLSGVCGISPMETLRRILAEEFAAGNYREQMWRSGARTSGFITRPPNQSGKKWHPDDRRRFQREWSEFFSGDGGGAGGTPVLEDGMTWQPSAMTPKDAQYVESRELTRQEVASAFYLPQAIIGLMDNANFPDIADQHVQLYQDSLSPWCEEAAQDFQMQLLPDLEPDPVMQRQIEFIFPFDRKLHGTPDQEIAAMSTATGRPFMTGNEARAWLGKSPQADDPTMDKVVQPLNVTAGARADGNGIASPHDTAPDDPDNTASNAGKLRELPGKSDDASTGAHGRTKVGASESHMVDALRDYYDKMGRAVKRGIKAQLDAKSLAVVGNSKDDGSANVVTKPIDIGSILEKSLWDDDLAEDMFDAATAASTEAAKALLSDWGYPTDEYDVQKTFAWLHVHTTAIAESMNAATMEDLQSDVLAPDPLAAVDNRFNDYRDNRAYQAGKTETASMVGFGVREAAQQFGFVETMEKTWQTGPKPRESHAALDGQTVPMGDVFSNGARWPGDSILPPEERDGCNCSLFVNDTSSPEGELNA